MFKNDLVKGERLLGYISVRVMIINNKYCFILNYIFDQDYQMSIFQGVFNKVVYIIFNYVLVVVGNDYKYEMYACVLRC